MSLIILIYLPGSRDEQVRIFSDFTYLECRIRFGTFSNGSVLLISSSDDPQMSESFLDIQDLTAFAPLKWDLLTPRYLGSERQAFAQLSPRKR
jgi:hypothetical protein